MAMQFRDGSFGETMPAADIVKQLAAEVPANLKSVHFGTEKEIEEIKKQEGLQTQFNDLQSKVAELSRAADPTAVKVYPADALDKLQLKE